MAAGHVMKTESKKEFGCVIARAFGKASLRTPTPPIWIHLLVSHYYHFCYYRYLSFTPSFSFIFKLIPHYRRRPFINCHANISDSCKFRLSSFIIHIHFSLFRLLKRLHCGSMSYPVVPLPLTEQMGIVEDGIKLLPAVNDEHGGVIVDMKEPMDGTVFLGSLKASMSQWKYEGKRGVWIKLPIELANLVEIAVKEGFGYHHAEPNYLMLVHWLPKSVCTIPANASHRVSIGAIVLTEKQEVLVVQEKIGRFRGTGMWKIPTGVVDEGEDISVAAVREVKEETAIDTEFVEVLAFRQTHKSFFDKSDLFFLCFLRPLSHNIQKQDLEIEAAQWMPFEEYAAQPLAQKSIYFKLTVNSCLAKLDKNYAGFSPEPVSSGEKPPYLYVNTKIFRPSGCPVTTDQL